MRLTFKKIAAVPALLLAFVAVSCSESDGGADYGLEYIYMPQAMVSGGVNNQYTVPSGDGKYTYNFKADQENNTLDVLLGVLRSGTQDGQGFTVDVDALIAQTQQAIDQGAVSNAELLPSSAYTLPDKVSVAAGNNSASFTLSVDMDVLNLSEYDGKNLVLTVGISNPTRYELSEENTATLVIINVNSIRGYF